MQFCIIYYLTGPSLEQTFLQHSFETLVTYITFSKIKHHYSQYKANAKITVCLFYFTYLSIFIYSTTHTENNKTHKTNWLPDIL